MSTILYPRTRKYVLGIAIILITAVWTQRQMHFPHKRDNEANAMKSQRDGGCKSATNPSEIASLYQSHLGDELWSVLISSQQWDTLEKWCRTKSWEELVQIAQKMKRQQAFRETEWDREDIIQVIREP